MLKPNYFLNLEFDITNYNIMLNTAFENEVNDVSKLGRFLMDEKNLQFSQML